MEIDVVLLSEVIERCVAGGIRRLRWGDLELEFTSPEAPPDPVSIPVRERLPQAEDANPYDRLFAGQKPVFPKNQAE